MQLKPSFACFAALLLPTCVFALVISETKPEADDVAVENIKSGIRANHTDLVSWFQRATQRLKADQKATDADLDEIRDSLVEVREQVYRFVTSPLFNLTTALFIEEAAMKAAPFLGVMPLKEIREFMNIVGKDPSLTTLILENRADLVTKVFPEVEELETWFANKTIRIFGEIMQPPTDLDEGYDYQDDAVH